VTTIDAIVVLGCTVSLDGYPSAALRRRLDMGALLFRRGVAPRVIVSGGRRWGKHVEAVVMRDSLVERGLPPSALTMELCSLTTAENCWFTAQLLPPESRVMVATCAWHHPRAARNFRRVGIEAVSPPADCTTTPPASLYRRAREHVNMAVDWCMMPRARHG
jgi:uncharacterized SAM-binding protein YcdF (DUF218 family)